VRYGPNRLSINSNTALHDIYEVKANVQKSSYYSVFSHFFKVPMSMTTIDLKKHAFKRRIDHQAMSQSAIKGMEDLVLKNVRIFCDKLIDEGEPANKDGWYTQRDMSAWTGYVTSDTMGDVTFNRNWNVLQSSENRGILEILPQGVSGLNLSGHMPHLLTLKIDQIIFRKLTAGTYRFKELSAEQSTWRLQNAHNIKTPDLFAALLDARDPETGLGFTQEELISEAGLLIIAGSDTMATAMAALFFYILHNPSTYARLEAEVLATFSDVEDIRIGPVLNSARYLHACLEESLRMSPGVGGILPREVRHGGIIIDGEPIPAGVDVGVPHYVIHHNEAYYPSPFTFRPERWLLPTQLAPNTPLTTRPKYGSSPTATSTDETTTPASLQLANSAFCAFGVGRTGCVGKNLAYQEMGVIVARTMWLYEMRLAPGPAGTIGEGRRGMGWGREREGEFQLWDKFVSTHVGPMVEFRKRRRN
jgi:cytochrome P450